MFINNNAGLIAYANKMSVTLHNYEKSMAPLFLAVQAETVKMHNVMRRFALENLSVETLSKIGNFSNRLLSKPVIM
jgi:hypothetical protein